MTQLQLHGTRLLEERRKMINDKQLRAIHAKYGRDTANLPSIRNSTNWKQAELRAKIAERYGGDVLDYKSVRDASTYEQAQMKAREELGKSFGITFTSPQKAGEMKSSELGGNPLTQAQFDKLFKERLEQKVREARRIG